MNFLVHGMNYWPEPIGVGRYTGEMVRWLEERNHAIRVVTTRPYYPYWRSNAPEFAEEQAVSREPGKVLRVPVYVPRRPNRVNRLIHLASFGMTSLLPLCASRGFAPHVVFSILPTIASLPAAVLASRTCRAPLWVHVQDLEIDIWEGMNRATRLATTARRCEKWLLRKASVVSSISEPMLERISRLGVEDSRLFLMRNWADIIPIKSENVSREVRESIGVSPDQCMVLYSGNVGWKQGLRLLIECARELGSESGIVFIISGEGVAREKLMRESRGIGNVRWLGLQPRDRLPHLLRAADIHVIPQEKVVRDQLFPSKLGNIAASGRPVVVQAWPGTALERVVRENGMGRVTTPGNRGSFAAALLDLAGDVEERLRLGHNATRYVATSLRRDTILEQFEARVKQLVSDVGDKRMQKDE